MNRTLLLPILRKLNAIFAKASGIFCAVRSSMRLSATAADNRKRQRWRGTSWTYLKWRKPRMSSTGRAS